MMFFLKDRLLESLRKFFYWGSATVTCYFLLSATPVKAVVLGTIVENKTGQFGCADAELSGLISSCEQTGNVQFTDAGKLFLNRFIVPGGGLNKVVFKADDGEDTLSVERIAGGIIKFSFISIENDFDLTGEIGEILKAEDPTITDIFLVNSPAEPSPLPIQIPEPSSVPGTLIILVGSIAGKFMFRRVQNKKDSFE